MSVPSGSPVPSGSTGSTGSTGSGSGSVVTSGSFTSKSSALGTPSPSESYSPKTVVISKGSGDCCVSSAICSGVRVIPLSRAKASTSSCVNCLGSTKSFIAASRASSP